jgi:hypothetical protein
LIVKIFSPKNWAKKLPFSIQNKAKLCINLNIFEKTPIFAEIAENCDHNIDPSSQFHKSVWDMICGKSRLCTTLKILVYGLFTAPNTRNFQPSREKIAFDDILFTILR